MLITHFEQDIRPKEFNNGDIKSQLLARSRYLLYKAPNNLDRDNTQKQDIIRSNIQI